jgi:hypothetical protein
MTIPMSPMKVDGVPQFRLLRLPTNIRHSPEKALSALHPLPSQQGYYRVVWAFVVKGR